MSTYDFDLGVIGGGAAGLTVTAGAAQLGASTLLIEKEKELGGDCLHFGCVPSKTLIKTARVYHLLKNSSRYGLPPVVPAPVDFREVSRRIQSVIEVIQKHDSVERFRKLGARVEFGSPCFIDEHTVELNGKNYSAKTWVLATGSSPAIPSITGLTATPYLTNREIFSLERLPRTMAVLGAGPIATEMAQAFARLGARVHVIQRSSQILSKEDRDVADLVMRAIETEGVTFHLNSAVKQVAERQGSKEVIFTDANGAQQKLEVEAILVAMGRRANVAGLGLENIGIDFDQRGIKVDNRLRTSQKHIYAAGDINGVFQFTHAAGYEAGIVLSNAIFHLPRKTDYTWMPWCTYCSPEVASIGSNEQSAQKAGIAYTVWSEEFASNDRALSAGEETGRIKLILNRKERPIGLQIIGSHAGDLLGEWVAVLNGNVKLSTLAGAVHPYPTLAEINKRVAANFFAGKIFSEKVRKLLKFFFRLRGDGQIAN